MNPYDPRGLELPEGCKDLIDALGLPMHEKPKRNFFRGGVASIEGLIATLLRSPSVIRWVAVLWTGQTDFVCLVNARGSLSAVINCSRGKLGHEQAIRGIFHEAGVMPTSESVSGGGSFTKLSYPLSPVAKEAADLVTEVLLRGCVALERPTLLFHVFEHSSP
jgi:hypothetical protein